uniref:Uncharacterized protein n=1 Tax=Anguilla anguilla TaxID=7936 RepID=A0A0E9R465_ANGAN
MCFDMHKRANQFRLLSTFVFYFDLQVKRMTLFLQSQLDDLVLMITELACCDRKKMNGYSQGHILIESQL